ncbi:MAG: exodeoxyribonuclease VII small subunit [Peptococcaceae bacterium]|nr:exodeoxyribonuclease VII small subunit [Peptococcaceae bacterium]
MAEMSFEEALARLGQVVDALEKGEVPLEEALDLFAEGVRLSKHCHNLLEKAEQRIQVLEMEES